jgi:hypothetical protein
MTRSPATEPEGWPRDGRDGGSFFIREPQRGGISLTMEGLIWDSYAEARVYGLINIHIYAPVGWASDGGVCGEGA